MGDQLLHKFVQRIPHALAVHIVPQRQQMLGLGVIELLDGRYPRIKQAPLHALDDAGNIILRAGEKWFRRVSRVPYGSDFTSDILTQPFFNAVSQLRIPRRSFHKRAPSIFILPPGPLSGD